MRGSWWLGSVDRGGRGVADMVALIVSVVIVPAAWRALARGAADTADWQRTYTHLRTRPMLWNSAPA